MDINVKSARGAVGDKTNETIVLPWFWKIEWGGNSGGAPVCYGVLSWLKFSPILADATECCEISNTTLSRFYLKNLSHFNEILFEILPASLELSHVSVDMVFCIENFDVWLNTQQGNGYKKRNITQASSRLNFSICVNILNSGEQNIKLRHLVFFRLSGTPLYGFPALPLASHTSTSA